MSEPVNASDRGNQRGFPYLRCICCGNDGGVVLVSLEDVTRFHCAMCSEDFTADAVRKLLTEWQAVLDWCGAAPVSTWPANTPEE